jgi:hypothetical protein
MTRLLAAALLLVATPAFAQSPGAAAEVAAGYAGFVDDAYIDHFVIGGTTRFYLSPRISVGPELVYMRGPGEDRDLFVTGNVTFDVLSPRAERRVTPFLVVGGGFSRFSDRIGPNDFSSFEGAVTGGGGARIMLTDRLYALGEFRIGWEPHYRMTGGVGVTW